MSTRKKANQRRRNHVARAAEAARLKAAHRDHENAKLAEMGEEFLGEVRRALSSAPLADLKAFTARATELAQAIEQNPGGMERIEKVMDAMMSNGSFSQEGGKATPILKAAFDRLSNTCHPVCPHIEYGPRPAFFCHQHMDAGIICNECWPDHLAAHSTEEEFTCDVCRKHTTGLYPLSLVPQIGVPIMVNGMSRLNPEPVSLVGIGVCESCK